MLKGRFVFSGKRLVICLIWQAFILAAFFILPPFWNGVSNDTDPTALVFHSVDVGQGDCLIVEFPDNKVLMVDTGTKDKYPRVKNYLNMLGVETINWFVNTHPDLDHYGGLPLLVNDFEIEELYRSPFVSTNSTFLEFADDMEIPTYMQTILGDNYIITFVSPTLTDSYALSNSNDSSLMITVEYENKIFVLTGDASKRMEDLFVERAAPIFDNLKNKQIILKVGHHGSNTSSGENFLNFIFNGIDPKDCFAVISCGTTYDHPHLATVERLKAKVQDNNIFVTKDVGDIAVVATQNSLTIILSSNNMDYRYIFFIISLIVIILCFFN